MERIRSTKRILDFATNFGSGVGSVLTPGRKNRQLRKVVNSIKQDDGLYEYWQAVGNDLRVAINRFKTEMTLQRK